MLTMLNRHGALIMIDQTTGLIDSIAIHAAARTRAQREYGAPEVPPCYLRESLTWCQERAEAMARAWRRERGLPVEVAVTWVSVPEWGASGDSFAA
jgi:hypothetical protein